MNATVPLRVYSLYSWYTIKLKSQHKKLNPSTLRLEITWNKDLQNQFNVSLRNHLKV